MKNLNTTNSIFSSTVFLLGLILITSLSSFATTINVNTVAALQAAINSSVSGDIIILKDGTYTDIPTLIINKSGITVMAATLGGVIFNGTSKCEITGNLVTFSGFQFVNGDIGTSNIIEIRGNNNTITQCNFFGVVAHNFLHFNSGYHNNTVSYTNFEAKPANPDGSPLIPNCTHATGSTTCGNAGPSIQISTSATVISYTKINHCTFMNFIGNSGDFGNEPIRIGLGVEQTNTSASIVEYCYFENAGPGDAETISLKSRWNVIRFNTQRNNPLGSFSFRAGSNNTAYSNFFIKSGGIRIKEGDSHMVFNNYFQGTGTNPSIELRNDGDLAGVLINNIFIYHNTFYKTGDLLFNSGNGTTIPSNVKFVNNLIQKSASNILIASDINSNPNVTFLNNFYQGTLGITATANQFTSGNQNLILNSQGYYNLGATSPAIDAASGAYTPIVVNPYIDIDPNLLLDFEGQTRPIVATLKDVGCDEFTTGIATNQPLIRSEAGPTYLATNLAATSFERDKNKIVLFPNPTYDRFFVDINKNSNTIAAIEIIDVSGRLLLSIPKSEVANEISIASFPSGIYFVAFFDDQNQLLSVNKILKK